MNELATTSTRQSTDLAAAPQRNAFEQYSEATNQNKIVGDLLKFNKGDWLAGQNEDEIEHGTKLVANMEEAMVGWVKWEGGKPVDMHMGRIAEGFQPPRRKELGDLDETKWERDDRGETKDPWQLTNYLILKQVDGDGLYTFATSSKGGINAVGRLCGAFGKTMRQRPDQFPIVALNSDSYKHPNKDYGRIKVPQFDIEGWAAKADFAEAMSTEAAKTEEAAADKNGTLQF